MSPSFRSFFSTAFGPSLTLLTATSAWLNGPIAVPTVLGFSLTVVYGITEIAMLGYPRHTASARELVAAAEELPRLRLSEPVRRMVDFPTDTGGPSARAA